MGGDQPGRRPPPNQKDNILLIHKIETETFPIIVEPLKGRPGAYLKQGASFVMVPESAYADLVDALEDIIHPDRPAAVSPAKAVKELGVLHLHRKENQ